MSTTENSLNISEPTPAASSPATVPAPVLQDATKHKRTAERQLTKDDDPDDDDVDGGNDNINAPFRKASEEVLKGRKILKAKRPVGSANLTDLITATTTTKNATEQTSTAAITETITSTTNNPFASTTLVVTPAAVSAAAAPVETTTGTDSNDAKVLSQQSPKDQYTSTHADSTAVSATTTTTTKVFGASAGFGGGFPSTGFGTAASNTTNKNDDDDNNNNNSTSSTTTSTTSTGFAFASSTSGFGAASTTSSIFGSIPSNSFTFGFANKPTEEKTTSALSPPKVALPESVDLTTGEEEEINIHDCRCKTFKWVPSLPAEPPTPTEAKATLSVQPSKDFQIQTTDSDKQKATEQDEGQHDVDDKKDETNTNESTNYRWQELGVGPMKLLQDHSDPPKYRLVQRRESTPNGPATKVLLNLPLYKESKVSLKNGQENYLSFITIGNDGCHETYLWKFKEVSQAQMFARFLEGILPNARSCFVG